MYNHKGLGKICLRKKDYYQRAENCLNFDPIKAIACGKNHYAWLTLVLTSDPSSNLIKVFSSNVLVLSKDLLKITASVILCHWEKEWPSKWSISVSSNKLWIRNGTCNISQLTKPIPSVHIVGVHLYLLVVHPVLSWKKYCKNALQMNNLRFLRFF